MSAVEDEKKALGASSGMLESAVICKECKKFWNLRDVIAKVEVSSASCAGSAIASEGAELGTAIHGAATAGTISL